MKLDHVAIQVKNVKASTDWYTSNLRAEILYIDETWAMLEVGGTKLALTIASQHPPHLAFAVDSAKSIPAPTGIHRDGSVYQYLEDPDGNTIEYIYYPEDIALSSSNSSSILVS
jgi:catechol 2,3-dioxygenase-like lactoylglutathione lyase family enzyme